MPSPDLKSTDWAYALSKDVLKKLAAIITVTTNVKVKIILLILTVSIFSIANRFYHS